MSLDVFIKKKYDADNYNCAHFVSEVWEYLYQQNINKNLQGFLLPITDKYVLMDLRKAFKKLKKPQEPCIVLMCRFNGSSHVGIYRKRKVFHLREDGVALENLRVASIGFKRVNFYEIEKNYNC